MKIIRLKSENVMRLVAVDITPEGSLVTVGGKNDAGKSSVLNSIAMALGGQAMCPAEPIRAGETEAKITVDMGDLVVTRRFTRSRAACDCIVSGNKDKPKQHGADPHAKDCAYYIGSLGETTSTLVVTNKDGAKYPSPQAMLDRLFGRLAFDPLAFANEGKTADGAKRQTETLRKLVGVDVTEFDTKVKDASARRLMLKKTHAIKIAQLAALPTHKEAPSAEVSMAEVTKEMAEAERLLNEAGIAAQRVQTVQTLLSNFENAAQTRRARIEELQKQVAALQAELAEIEPKHGAAEKSLADSIEAREVAKRAVPDQAAIRLKLADVESMNVKVRTNQKHAEVEAEVKDLDARIHHETMMISAAEKAKHAALVSAQFPVPGLGLSDDGVVFGGLPFSQASSSEQLRVSVAIGLALNPTLKVLLIRNGNLLDEDKLKLVAEQAEAAEAQVWMEYVTSDAKDVQVMIEDGHVMEGGISASSDSNS